MDLNKFGKRAYKCALKRHKVYETNISEELHMSTIESVFSEANEVKIASETESSPHLPQYTEVAEELADVAIVALTELNRRGVDIEAILHEKMKYNEQRAD